VTDELGRIEAIMAYLKYYLGGTDENHEELSQYSRCPRRDSRLTLREKNNIRIVNTCAN
jgi:hypothetical protein